MSKSILDDVAATVGTANSLKSHLRGEAPRRGPSLRERLGEAARVGETSTIEPVRDSVPVANVGRSLAETNRTKYGPPPKDSKP